MKKPIESNEITPTKRSIYMYKVIGFGGESKFWPCKVET